MSFYQYSVSNSQGQLLQGTMQAASLDAARLALSSAGYVVHDIKDQAASKPVSIAAPAAPRSAPRPAPPLSSVQAPLRPPQPAPLKSVENPAAQRLNAGGDPAAKPTGIKTKKGRDKDLFFLFTQLGSYFRSGFNPGQALSELTARTPERYHESLRLASQTVLEGGRMSDAFEAYPYLYPPDVIGTIRAGEVAGFLPEAMDEVADKMHGSHRLKKRLIYFWYIFLATVGMTPLTLGIIEGSLASMKEQDVAGGSLPAGATLWKAVGRSMVHDLPVTVLICGAIWAFLVWFNSMKMRPLRHSLIMRMPILGGRAAAESMARFTWALGMISKAGMSPHNTFLLGLQSVPNLAIRKRLELEGEQMSEKDKLSTAIKRAGVLPIEYGQIVETGEVVGDVPRALESVHKATDADYRARNDSAPTATSYILYGLLGVLICFIAGWLLTKYYGGLFTTILGD